MIDPQRLSKEFARLAAINSPPLHESSIASYLAERLQRLGAEIRFDAAATATGGEVGNLVASFPGNGKQVEPLLFSVHMDTVEPGGQVEPVLRDGVFYSAGDTILGADDKAEVVLEELGAHAVVNYRKEPDLAAALARTCPEGVDVYFDNVGGVTLDAALMTMAQGGRIVGCGMISDYNSAATPTPLYNLWQVVERQLKMQGNYNVK